MSLQFLSMNLASFLIGGAICGVISLVLYLVYTFGIREKSFEEVLEEQRKRSEQEELQQKNEKSKKDKEKKHKKWGKKTKEKNEQTSPVAEPTVTVTQDSSEEAETIEPKETVVSKKKSKALNQKATTPPLKSAAVVPEKPSPPAAATVHSSPEVEKKGKPEKVVSKDKEKEKPKISELPKVTQAEKSEPEVSAPVQAAPALAVNKKKKKAEQSDKSDVGHVTATKLISLIKEAAMSDEESQMLINILLNKQKEASGWKKVDYVVAKKQPHEPVPEQEQRQNQAAPAKPKQESAQVQSKASNNERMLVDKIALQNQEMKSLNLKLKQTQEQFSVEKSATEEKLKLMQKAADEKTNLAVKRVTEERDKLAKSVKRLESESRTAALTSELEQAKKSREDLVKVHKLLIDQHTQIISNHKREVLNLNAQLSEAKNSQQDTLERRTAVSDEINALKQKCEGLEVAKNKLEHEAKAKDSSMAEVTRLMALLEESKAASNSLEGKAKNLSEQVNELTKENNKLSSDLNNLQAKNERLSTELTKSNERVAGDGQEMLQHNGEVNGKAKETKEFVDHEKILQEKESVMSQLYDELKSCNTKIVSLNDELELQKTKNNELREKNWKIMDSLTASEKMVTDAVKEATEKSQLFQAEKIENLRLENSKYEASLAEQAERLSRTDESMQQLKELSSNQLQQYNSQVEKNDLLLADMKQLQNLRDSLENKLADSSKTVKELESQVKETENSCRSCLQRIFPAITVDNSSSLSVFLTQFEKQATDALQSQSNSKEVEELLARFSDEKEELQTKLTQYEAVLADTDASLKRLQESAKDQHSVWEEQLHSKEEEIANLQESLTSLQSEMETVKTESGSSKQKLEEINQNYINLKQQIDTKDKTIDDLQKEVASFDHLKKELEDAKSKLEKEKKISKDFSSQMVRLDSLVKIGQDALKAEQETVKRLQNQVEAAKVVTTANGTSSPTITEEKGSTPEKKIKPEKPKKSKKTDASGKK